MATWWTQCTDEDAKPYTCGYCGHLISTHDGWKTIQHKHISNPGYFALICNNCGRVTFLEPKYELRYPAGSQSKTPRYDPPVHAFVGYKQTPGEPYGKEVKHIEPEVKAVYDEARKCYRNEYWTACVMLCRKLIMNIAYKHEEHGIAKDKNFTDYVQYMKDKHIVPSQSLEIADKILALGNSANHEIEQLDKPHALICLKFLESILVLYDNAKEAEGIEVPQNRKKK